MIDSPLVQTLGLVLIHFLWQGLLIGLLYGAFRRVLKNHSAVARYNWGVICLILLALAPLLTFVWLFGSPAAYTGSADLVVKPSGYTAIAMQPEPGLFRFSLFQLLPWIVGLWLCGVALMSARLGAGWWYIRQLRSRADYAVSPALRQQLERLTGRLNMTGRIALAYSSQIAGPMLVGLYRPLILMPASLINRLSVQQLEMVLAHELAHFQRADHLVNFFQNIVETLLFYHPVVRWISNELRAERELISDEQAARLTGDRLAYAETLLQLERVRGDRLAFSVGMADHQLVTRVRHLLAPQTRQSGSVLSGMTVLTMVLVSTLTALVSTGLQTFSAPDSPAFVPVSESSVLSGVVADDVDQITQSVGSSAEPAEPARADMTGLSRSPVVAQSTTNIEQPAIELAPIRPAANIESPRPLPIESPASIADLPLEAEPVGQSMPSIESEPDWAGSQIADAGPELMMASLAVPARPAEILGGDLLNGPVPNYPLLAVRRSREGQVELELTVNPDGTVGEVVITKETPRGYGFAEAATQAVQDWRFEPFTRNGRAVRHQIQTGFDFTDPPPCERVTGTRLARC